MYGTSTKIEVSKIYTLRLFIFASLLSLLLAVFAIPQGTAGAQQSNDPIQELKAHQAGDFISACAEMRGYKSNPTSGDLKAGDFIHTPRSARTMVAVSFYLSDSGLLNCNDKRDVSKAMDALGTDAETLLTTGDNPVYELDGSKYKLVAGGDDGASLRRLNSSIDAQLKSRGYNTDISNAAKYFSFLKTFEETCGKDGASPNGSEISRVNSETGEIKKEKYVLKYENPRDALSAGNALYDAIGGVGTVVDVGMNVSCSNLVNFINAFATQASSAVKNGEIDPGSGSATETEPSCESENGVMSWVMCPVIKMIDSALNWIDTQIQALLEINSDYYGSPELQKAHANIRNIAFVVLVPVVLVMVIGTALGFDFVSAYTVKRALPRLIIAVIFIAISYPICLFLILFFNELGSATLGLLTAPFANAQGSAGGLSLASMFGGSVFLGLMTSIPALGSIIVLIWLFGGTILLFAAIAFLVLMLRQMFIIALLMVAPLAILAWIFPGNDKLWKLWWGSFSKLLIMYPLIMAVIAMGRVFAFIIHNGGGGGLEGALFKPIMTIVAYTIPYAFIPFTFKFAGGMFATVTGMVNDRGKGMFDRQRKRRERIKENTTQRAKTGNFIKGAPEGSRRARFNTGIAYATNAKKAGLRPSMWKGNMQGALADADFEHAMEESEKLPGAKSFFANDTLMMAGLEGGGDLAETRNYLARKDGGNMQGKELDIALGQVMRMRKEMGGESFTLAALAKLPGTGTAFEEEDIGKWHELVAKNTHGNRSLQGSLVAMGKSGFRNAQRYEVSEAGFGDHMEAIQMAERGEDTKDITGMIVDKAYLGGGPAAVVGARNHKSAGMFAKTINKRLDEAKSNLATLYATPGADEQAIAAARREVIQQQAAVASIHDNIGSAKQIVGKTLADDVMHREAETVVKVVNPVTGQTMQRTVASGKTQLQEVNTVRHADELHEMRRELGESESDRARRESTMSEAAIREAELRARQDALKRPGDDIQPPAPGSIGPSAPF